VFAISQYAITTDAFLVKKPKSLNHVEAASMPLVAMTAVQAFDKVNTGLEGKIVLVTAGRKFI
jgi:NADPH:quinone reductase-like Zn-dependent oxidoreductase